MLNCTMKWIYLLLITVYICEGVNAQNKINNEQNNLEMDTPILGLRTVCYFVENLDEAKQWYTKAFGVEPYFDEPFYVGFNIGGYELGLQPDENPTKEKSSNILAYWGVNDIQKEYNRMLRSGATEHEKPTNVGGDLMVASVRDPWGNIVGLIYNPYFKLKE